MNPAAAHPTHPVDVLANVPTARAGALKLARLGYSICSVEIDREGVRCKVSLADTTVHAIPCLQPIIDCCAWLLEHGHTTLAAEWRGGGKKPIVWILPPHTRLLDLEQTLIGNCQRGGQVISTWCAVYRHCEIRWEEAI